MSSVDDDGDAEVPVATTVSSKDSNKRKRKCNESDDEEFYEKNVQRKKKPYSNRTKKISKKPEYDDVQVFEVLQKFFDENGAHINCNIPDCKSTISRYQLYYMRRHFERCHQSKLMEIFPKMISHDKQLKIDMYELLHNCIEIVTVNGFPFSILDTPAMKGNIAFFIKMKIVGIIIQM